MPKIKALLFDMDGVLVDARDWHYDALNKALTLFGMQISRDEHLATYDGLPTKQKLKILSASRGLPVKLHEFLNDVKQMFTEEIVVTRCKPIFHIQYALSMLRKDGYKIAVCSNSVRNSVERMMHLSGLLGYLDFFLSNEDVVRPKPDPQIYQTAIGKYKLTPNECLIVEDNDKGIESAKASGAHVMEVNNVEDVTYTRIINIINTINSEI